MDTTDNISKLIITKAKYTRMYGHVRDTTAVVYQAYVNYKISL